MAKDFTNTQTGGEGVTAQVGDKSTASKAIKKPQGKPAPTANKTGGEEPTSPAVAEAPQGVKTVEPTNTPIPLEEEAVDIFDEEEVAEVDGEVEESFITDINPEVEDLDKSSNFSFSASELQPLDDLSTQKANSRFSVTGAVDDGEDYVDIPEEDPIPVKENKVLSYPGTDLQYTIKDGQWYDRSDSSKEWKAIKSPGRVYGLNDYHKTKAAIPKSDYNPVKGGFEVDGMRVYGHSAKPGVAYTIHNGAWNEMKKGSKSWTPIADDRRIKDLNSYHGEKVKTSDDIKAKSANLKPTSSLEKGEAPDYGSRAGNIMAYTKRDIEKDQQERLLKSLGDKSNQAGKIADARSLGFGKTDVDVKVDKDGNAITSNEDPIESLFGREDRPSDLIGASLWDAEHGLALPPTQEQIRFAKEGKNAIMEDLSFQLEELTKQGKGEGHPEYELVKKDFADSIEAADLAIEQANIAHSEDTESFKTKDAYMKSDQYQIDIDNSAYSKRAKIQDRLNETSYGMYDPTAVDRQSEEAAKIGLLDTQINNEMLDNFVETDIDKWSVGKNLSESQLAQLKMVQKSAKTDESRWGARAATMMYEVEEFIEQSYDVNNRLAEAHNRGMDLTEVLIENKKIMFENGKHLMSDEVKSVFTSTIAIHDFMAPYIDSKKIIRDQVSGRYEISEEISGHEREYIEGQLTELIDKYHTSRSEIYSKERNLLKVKKQEIDGLHAAIAKAELEAKSGDGVVDKKLKGAINKSMARIQELKSEIREVEMGENTILLTDPNAISENVSTSTTASSRMILQAIPDGITPKQKFDLFYESLLKKNNDLASKYNIAQGTLDVMGEKAADILDWEYLGLKLSSKQIEYYKNAATLRKIAPIYFNNDWGVTDSSAGFYESFMNGLVSVITPETAGAFGHFNETDAVAAQMQISQALEFTDEDYASGTTIDQMLDRTDVDFISAESFGGMIGTTSGIMLAMVGSGNISKGVLKGGKGVAKLISKYEKLDSVTDAVKDFKRVEQAYASTMKSTKLGKYAYESIDQGLKMQISGMLFNMDEELNFMSGLGGALAGKALEGVMSKIPPSKAVEWIGGMFGSNTERAVAVLKKLGKDTKKLGTAHYRGMGEMPEEFAQELIGIYRDELRTRGFWDTVNDKYFKDDEALSNLGELLVSSYVMGAGIGIVTSKTQQDIIDDLPPRQLEMVNIASKAMLKDIMSGQAHINITAGRIANNIEIKEGLEASSDTKTEKPKTEAAKEAKEQTTEEKPKEETKPAEIGELVLENGKVGTWKKMPESGTVYFDEKPGMSEVDIKSAIEAGTIRDVSKPVETKTEADSKAKVVPISEKVRKLKIKDSDTSEEISTVSTPEKAVEMWEQGFVPVVDGKPVMNLTSEETAKMVEGDESIDMVQPKAKAASLVPKKVWNTAVEGLAVTVKTVEKIASNVRNSDWYKKLRASDPERANKVDAQLAKIESGIKETGIEYKAPKNPTPDVEQIKSKIKTFRQGHKAGVKLTKEQKKAKVDEINEVQEDLLAYARKNLPKGDYRYTQNEITTLMNTVRRATSPRGITNALDAIDKKMSDFQEKARVQSAADIMEAFDDPQLKKRGVNKVGNISLEARAEVKKYKEEMADKNVPDMTQEQLNEVDAKLNSIIDEGKSVITEKERAKKEEKRQEREVPFRVLAEQNKSFTGNVEGEKQIGDFFTTKQGAIIYDGELFKSKQSLDEYLDNKGISYDNLGALETTSSRDVKSAQVKYEKNNSKTKKVTRKVSDAVQEVNRTLESRLMDIYRGSKELRIWTRDKILRPVEKAYYNTEVGRKVKLDEFKKGLRDVFGKSVVTGLPKMLNKDSGLTIYREGTSLTNNQAVNIHTMATVAPSMIYEVDGDYYNSENKAVAAAKAKIKAETGAESVTDEEAKGEMIEVTDKYNVAVIEQISDGADSLRSGLEKIAEIEAYVNSDEKLKSFTELIKSSYINYREDYKDTFEELYDLEFKDGDYVPLTRNITSDLDANDSALLGTDFKGGASTAMANSLKKRFNNSDATFDFNTGAYEKLLNYVNTMEHAKHFLPVAEASKNLMNKATKPQLIEKLGNTRVADLEYHLNDIITDGKVGIRNKSGKIVDTLLKYNVVTTLGYKLASVPKQLTSATHYFGAGLEDGVSTSQVILESAKLLSATGLATIGQSKMVLSGGEYEMVKAVFTSAFVKSRLSGRDIDFETRKMLNELQGSKGKNLQNNIVRIMLAPTVMGDIGGVLTGGIPFALATYNNNMKKHGMTSADAMSDALEKFVTVSNKTQQSIRRDILSNAQKDPKYRAFLTYKTSQIAATAQLVKGVKILGDTKGGYTAKEKVAAGRKVLYYTVSNAIFQAVATGALGMYFLSDNDDDEREKERKSTVLHNLIWDTISSDAQGFGLPGMIADWGLNVLRNREIFNNVPVVNMAKDVANVVATGFRLAYDGEIAKDASDADMALFAKVLGLKNINKQAEAWQQYGKDEINAWDAIMGRTVDEETGHKYETGDERGDWIYGIFFPKEEQGVGVFRDNVQDKMDKRKEGRDDPFSGKSTSEKLLERRNSGSSTVEYTNEAPNVGRISEGRDKEAAAARIKTEESMKNPRKVSPTKSKPSGAQEESERLARWRKAYEEKFFAKPSQNMGVQELMDVLLHGE